MPTSDRPPPPPETPFTPPPVKRRLDGTPDLRRPDGSLPPVSPIPLPEAERSVGETGPEPKEGQLHTNRWAAKDPESKHEAIIYCMEQSVAQMVADKHFGCHGVKLCAIKKIGYVTWIMLDKGLPTQRLVQKTITTDPEYESKGSDVDHGMGKPPQK